jgi:hypothetical protein
MLVAGVLLYLLAQAPWWQARERSPEASAVREPGARGAVSTPRT